MKVSDAVEQIDNTENFIIGTISGKVLFFGCWLDLMKDKRKWMKLKDIDIFQLSALEYKPFVDCCVCILVDLN